MANGSWEGWISQARWTATSAPWTWPARSSPATSAAAQVVLSTSMPGGRRASPSTEVTARSPARAASTLVPTFPLAPVTTTRMHPPLLRLFRRRRGSSPRPPPRQGRQGRPARRGGRRDRRLGRQGRGAGALEHGGGVGRPVGEAAGGLLGGGRQPGPEAEGHGPGEQGHGRGDLCGGGGGTADSAGPRRRDGAPPGPRPRNTRPVARSRAAEVSVPPATNSPISQGRPATPAPSSLRA